MNEVKIAISEFLRRYDFGLVKGYEMKYKLAFLYEPKDFVKVNLRRRS